MLQLAAAAVLTERLSPPLGRDRFARAEHRVVIRALLAVTKSGKGHKDQRDVPEALAKFIADQIALNHKVPLKEFDWQNCRLRKAWWPGIEAAGVDFWRSDLSKSGMRGASLQKATFAEAHLDGTVLIGADLRNANLKKASLREAKLHGAKLTGAILDDAVLLDALYDEKTTFPDGFDPAAAGMKLDLMTGPADRRA